MPLITCVLCVTNLSESKGTMCGANPLMSFVSESSPQKHLVNLNGNDPKMSSASKSAGEGLDAHEPDFHWDHLATLCYLDNVHFFFFGLISI